MRSKNRRARLAAVAVLAVALDGSMLGWALGNLPGTAALVAMTFSVTTIMLVTAVVWFVVAKIDRRLAMLRRARRVLQVLAWSPSGQTR